VSTFLNRYERINEIFNALDAYKKFFTSYDFRYGYGMALDGATQDGFGYSPGMESAGTGYVCLSPTLHTGWQWNGLPHQVHT
jgi:hypothetical protein